MKGSLRRDDGDDMRKAMWRTSTFTALPMLTCIVYWRQLLPADRHKQCHACAHTESVVLSAVLCRILQQHCAMHHMLSKWAPRTERMCCIRHSTHSYDDDALWWCGVKTIYVETIFDLFNGVAWAFAINTLRPPESVSDVLDHLFVHDMIMILHPYWRWSSC